MKFLSKLAALLAFALLVGACSGSDSGSSNAADQALIDALVAEFNEDPPPDNFDFDAACMAKGFVSELGGAKGIEEQYGITVDDLKADSNSDDLELDQAAAKGLVDKIWGCADFAGLMVSGFAGEGLSADDAACLVDKIGEDSVKEVFALGFMTEEASAELDDSTGEAFFAAVFEAIPACELDAEGIE